MVMRPRWLGPGAKWPAAHCPHYAAFVTIRPDMPARAHRTAKKALQPRIKIWLESRGRAVIGDGRVELLQAIGATGSLAGAAHRTGLSYRRAWGKVREMERNFGAPLVHSEKGGSARGSTRLTSEAEALVARYGRLRKLIESDLRREFKEVFSA